MHIGTYDKEAATIAMMDAFVQDNGFVNDRRKLNFLSFERNLMNTISAKTIVAKKQDTSWFGSDYNMNIYRGCCHGCIYC